MYDPRNLLVAAGQQGGGEPGRQSKGWSREVEGLSGRVTGGFSAMWPP
jgi:hypothetical protein